MSGLFIAPILVARVAVDCLSQCCARPNVYKSENEHLLCHVSPLHKNTVSKLQIIDEHSIHAELAHSLHFIGFLQRPAKYFDVSAMSVLDDLFIGKFN